MHRLPGWIRRWLDIVFLGIASLLVVLIVLAPALTGIGGWIGTRMAVVPPWARVPTLTVLVAFLFVPVVRIGGLTATWLRVPRCSMRFPPAVFAVLLAAPCFAFYADVWDWLWACVIMILGAVLALFVPHLTAYRASSHRTSTPNEDGTGTNTVASLPSIDALAEDPQRLIEWANRETPVDDPDDDLFNMRPAALRIARRISGDPRQSFALIGPYGCGKTTTLRFVEHYLQAGVQVRKHLDDAPVDGRAVWTCRIDGWGLETGASAVEYVLTKVVEELARHVDCMSVASLPADYRAALAGSGSTWGRLVESVLSNGRSTEATLRRLDSILDSVDRHIVVFLEDLDRNCPDRKLLPQIQALLDRIHQQLDRVTFVLATSYESKADIDFTKFCDGVEVLPTLNAMTAEPLMLAFCRHCREQFPKDICSNLGPDGNSAMKALGRPGRLRIWVPEGVNRQTYVSLRLISTPRRLKHTLRYTWRAWQALHGEIAFTDLLLVSVIRACVPEAFHFLLQNIEELRSLANEHDQKAAKKVQERLHADWSVSLGSVSDGDRNEAFILLGHLVPGWIGDSPASDTADPRQRVIDDEMADYWRRLNSEAIDDLSDQAVLRAIQAWKRKPEDASIAAQLIDNDPAYRGDKFVRFAAGGFAPEVHLSADEVRELATQVCELLLARDGIHADHGESPGLISVWSLVRNGPQNVELRSWLWQEIKKALGKSLRFALSLECSWTYGQLNYYRGQATNQRRIRCALVAWVKRTLANHGPKKLIELIDPSFPWSVRHLVRHTYPKSAPVFTPRQWKWFVPILLSAARSAPQAIGPQLAVLVSRSDFAPVAGPAPSTTETFELETDFVEAMFGTGDERLELMHFLDNAPEYPQLEADCNQRIQAIACQARQWLVRHDADLSGRDASEEGGTSKEKGTERKREQESV